MNNPPSFARYLNSQGASFATIAQACIDYVTARADGLTPAEMYEELIRRARDAGGVDQMLYQLEGDQPYAEHSALLVLSAAWNDPTQVAGIERAVVGAAAAADVDLRTLGFTVLYGMYLLARGAAPDLRTVTYRQADGTIVSAQLDTPIASATLFEAVRDQYGA